METGRSLGVERGRGPATASPCRGGSEQRAAGAGGAQVMVPGKPALSLTAVWALPFHPLAAAAPDTPFVRSLRTFMRGDDAERSTIFKLIPRRAAPGGCQAPPLLCPLPPPRRPGACFHTSATAVWHPQLTSRFGQASWHVHPGLFICGPCIDWRSPVLPGRPDDGSGLRGVGSE